MTSIFRVSMLQDCSIGKPHYPSYDVSRENLGTASSLENAEKMITSSLNDFSCFSIHSYCIDEIPVDRLCRGYESLSSYLYDHEGRLIDKRLFSSIRDDYGTYPGRTPEEIRFKEGDIVEVCYGSIITLGFVVGLPISREKALRINNSPNPIHLDDTDDSYTILFNSSYASHDHVSSLSLFKPRFKIHPAVERRLRKAYNDYVTYPAFWDIANATAEKKLDEILDEIGLGGSFSIPECHEEDFEVFLPLKSGNQKIIIDCNKVYNNIDRVRTTLFRIAGKPVSGRAFSIHKNKNTKEGSLVI